MIDDKNFLDETVKNYQITDIRLIKPQTLGDLNTTKKIDFAGNLGIAGNTLTFFILEEVTKTILVFHKNL